MTSWSYPTPADHALADRRDTGQSDPADDTAPPAPSGPHPRPPGRPGPARHPPAADLCPPPAPGLRNNGRPVGLATIYQPLAALTDAGLLHAFVVASVIHDQ
jgi:hypothetical protein